MKRRTIKLLENSLNPYPFLRAEGVSRDEIENAARQLKLSFPADFQQFLQSYGGAIVGSFPIYGLRPVEAMGNLWNIIEVNSVYRRQNWPAVENWLIVSADLSGNPIGIAPDGKLYLSDHDYGSVSMIAGDFDTFILSCIETPREKQVRVGELLSKPFDWIEIWIDGGSKEDFTYILILRQRVNSRLEIADPQKEYAVIAAFDTYEEARLWLREDEYEMVEGRWPEQD
jgi:cell wall assembly regulator SMI1